MDRSSRREVRNPLVTLPAVARIVCLPHALQLALRCLLIELRDECRTRAEKCWRTGKGPMALYYKVVGVYVTHTARLLRSDPLPRRITAEAAYERLAAKLQGDDLKALEVLYAASLRPSAVDCMQASLFAQPPAASNDALCADGINASDGLDQWQVPRGPAGTNQAGVTGSVSATTLDDAPA